MFYLKKSSSEICLKLFNVTGLFLFSLKTSENQRFSDVFRVYTDLEISSFHGNEP